MENDLKIPQSFVDANRHINVDYDWWEYTEEDFLENELAEHGYSCKRIFFDLYRRTSVEFDKLEVDDLQKIIDRCKTDLIKLAFPDLILLRDHGEYFYCSNGYNHVETQGMLDDIDLDNKVDKICDYLNEFIKEDLQALGSKYLKQAEQEYDYLTSDEAIIETIIANDLYNPEDGETWEEN